MYTDNDCSHACQFICTLFYKYMYTDNDCSHAGLSIFFKSTRYFTIYRWYFLLKLEQFPVIFYTTLFKIRRYQRPSQAGKSTWCHPLLKGWTLMVSKSKLHPTFLSHMYCLTDIHVGGSDFF